MKLRPRTGFTLVELLVVIAIIGILVALLLPAVQAAREAANRVQCQNNLKQLGLAVQNYHDLHRQMPASGIVDPTSGPLDMRSGLQFSWIVLVLPLFEQGPLHDQFDFHVNVFRQPNEPQSVSVPTLICPSDSSRGRIFEHPGLTNGKVFAKGNYAAYVSPFHVENQWRFPGAIITNRRQTLDEITDGTSNTLMLSEVRTRRNPLDQRGAWALPWTGSSLLAFDLHDIEDPIDFSKWGYVPNPAGLGACQPPNNPGPNTDILYDCPDPGDAQLSGMPCNPWTIATSLEYLSAAPRSQHRGGVNVVFVDGHLAFLTNQVESFTMAYMVSIQDGEVVNFDQAL